MSVDKIAGLRLDVNSPFMECITQCRSRMKKLRKKIYKNLKNKQHLQLQTSKTNNTFNLSRFISQKNIPQFLSFKSPHPSREDIVNDISCFILSNKVSHFDLTVYADQQEQEVQQIIMRNMEENKYIELPEQDFSEHHSTEDKVPSRIWLQSTQIDYEDSSLINPHSKISLRPFELFPEEESKTTPFNRLREEANGFLSLDSNELFEQQLFQF